MNVQLPVRLDKPAFLAWVQGREKRYELVDGRVVMMTGASRTHGLLVLNIAMLLRNQFDPRTVIADFGLDAGPKTLRYPDVMVDRAGGDYTTNDPVLLIEVLSRRVKRWILETRLRNICDCPILQPTLSSSKARPRRGSGCAMRRGFRLDQP